MEMPRNAQKAAFNLYFKSVSSNVAYSLIMLARFPEASYEMLHLILRHLQLCVLLALLPSLLLTVSFAATCPVSSRGSSADEDDWVSSQRLGLSDG